MHASSDLKSEWTPAGKKGSFEQIKRFLVLGWLLNIGETGFGFA